MRINSLGNFNVSILNIIYMLMTLKFVSLTLNISHELYTQIHLLWCTSNLLTSPNQISNLPPLLLTVVFISEMTVSSMWLLNLAWFWIPLFTSCILQQILSLHSKIHPESHHFLVSLMPQSPWSFSIASNCSPTSTCK